jgi:glycosyltransferase involved in cell wall biosynthesis
MSACDIFVHPSAASEGRPLSVVEAAAAGLAVVATPQGVAGDIIGSEREGILVPPRDAAALASALERALNEPGARSACAAALQRKVLDAFGWERIIDQAEAELLATQAARA